MPRSWYSVLECPEWVNVIILDFRSNYKNGTPRLFIPSEKILIKLVVAHLTAVCYR